MKFPHPRFGYFCCLCCAGGVYSLSNSVCQNLTSLISPLHVPDLLDSCSMKVSWFVFVDFTAGVNCGRWDLNPVTVTAHAGLSKMYGNAHTHTTRKGRISLVNTTPGILLVWEFVRLVAQKRSKHRRKKIIDQMFHMCTEEALVREEELNLGRKSKRRECACLLLDLQLPPTLSKDMRTWG